jgi:hypothetical protein
VQTNTKTASQSTFILAFGDGARCVARIDLDRIAALKHLEFLPRDVVSIEWGGKPATAAHFELYRAWPADVWQYVANTANKSVAHVLITPEGRALAIVCEPNSHPDFVFLPFP